MPLAGSGDKNYNGAIDVSVNRRNDVTGSDHGDKKNPNPIDLEEFKLLGAFTSPELSFGSALAHELYENYLLKQGKDFDTAAHPETTKLFGGLTLQSKLYRSAEDISGQPFKVTGTNKEGMLIKQFDTPRKKSDEVFWTPAGNLKTIIDLPQAFRF